MDMPVHFFVWLVTWSLFALGLVGIILPVLPGLALIWAGVLIHKIWLGPESVPWWFLVFATALLLLGFLLDLLCTWWGARRFGSSWLGALGAVAGGLLGLLLVSLPGLILGTVGGAILCEFIQQGHPRLAVRAGLGAVIGTFFGILAKGLLAIILIVSFFLCLPGGSGCGFPMESPAPAPSSDLPVEKEDTPLAEPSASQLGFPCSTWPLALLS